MVNLVKTQASYCSKHFISWLSVTDLSIGFCQFQKPTDFWFFNPRFRDTIVISAERRRKLSKDHQSVKDVANWVIGRPITIPNYWQRKEVKHCFDFFRELY
jgi:hypothetical protein